MRQLSGNDKTRALAQLRKVFTTLDPFDRPVAEDLPRLLLFSVPYVLDRSEFDAVVRAARACGDDRILVSAVEGTALSGDSHWELFSWDYEAYRELPDVGVLENALYSPSGRWGILISSERHAIAAGEPVFLENIATVLPSGPRALNGFTEYWARAAGRPGSDLSWIRAFIAHTVGEAEAEVWQRLQ